MHPRRTSRPRSVSANRLRRAARAYFSRHDGYGPLFTAPPDPDLRLCVTIPAYDEPELLHALRSLAACEPLPAGASCEVLVLLNAPLGAPQARKLRNQEALGLVGSASAELQRPGLHFHVALDNALPDAQAGVGLARKRVMDEALRRLALASRDDHAPALIAGFDADCSCDPNYLCALFAAFDERPDTAGASVYFEHDVGNGPDAHAIAHYELFLRYYRLGLRYAGSAHAFHTVGSSMAVSAESYARLGGMNRRKAAEDFHFLQKFMNTGRYININTTCVRPSARESDRVPFGTGAAMGRARREDWRVHFPAPAVFDTLKTFLNGLDAWFDAPTATRAELTAPMREFLDAQGFEKQLATARANASSPDAFAKHLRSWMNAFRTMKLVRAAGTLQQHTLAPQDCIAALATRLGEALPAAAAADLPELLHAVRELDRRLI